MSHDKFTPHIFEDTNVWIKKINPEWQDCPAADLHGIVKPNVVEAASGHTFVVTLRLGTGLTLEAGAHVTMEIPQTWEPYHGNCFRKGVRTIGHRKQLRAGYGVFADVACSNPKVELEWLASWGVHLDLLDIVVTKGFIEPDDEIRIVLGPEDGNQMQVQKYAQKAILPVGVDTKGNRRYQRAATHPRLDIVGAFADRLRVFAPATVAVNQKFPIRVLPVDYYSFNPATHYRGTVQLQSKTNLEMPNEIEINTEKHPKGISLMAKALDSGVANIVAVDSHHGISGRSNPIGVDVMQQTHVYFGELHAQMWHSMGTGTTAEYFEWGRDYAGLDFCAPANHYNWRFKLTDDIWEEMVATTNAFHEPGRFVTLVGYEWGHKTGHKNVYVKDEYVNFHPWWDAKSPEDLWNSLEGKYAITIPHHPKFCDRNVWDYRNNKYLRLVEMCSQWGISETGGDHSVQAALLRGHRIGFVGGTDTHYGTANQGNYHVNDGNGLACIFAPVLTRDAVWQGLYDRHCYATTGDRILLNFTMNGRVMGSDIPADLSKALERRFQMLVAGTYRIDKVEIIRNNYVVFRVYPKTDYWEGEWTDSEALASLAVQPSFQFDRPFVFYYLRVTQGNRQIAWTSPIWLTQK